jgi:hypothetical protein
VGAVDDGDARQDEDAAGHLDGGQRLAEQRPG